MTAELRGFMQTPASRSRSGARHATRPSSRRQLPRRCTRRCPRPAPGRPEQIGTAVEDEVTARGYAVCPELTGHGIGRRIHEPPEVPNYFGRPSSSAP